MLKWLIVFIVQQVTCLSYHDPLTLVLGCVQQFEESTPGNVLREERSGVPYLWVRKLLRADEG